MFFLMVQLRNDANGKAVYALCNGSSSDGSVAGRSTASLALPSARTQHVCPGEAAPGVPPTFDHWL